MVQPSSKWPVVVAFALLVVASQVCWLAYATITTVTARRYDVSEQAVAWLAGIFPLLFVLLALPAGWALDRWFRGSLAGAGVLMALGAAIRLADTYPAALIGQTLVAVAQPVILIAISYVAARYLAPDDRPRGIALGAGATSLGMITGIGLGTALSDDVRTVVGIGTAIAVVASLAALAAFRVPPPFEPARAEPPTLPATWREPGVPRIALFAFLGMGVFIALATWLEPLLAPAGIAAGTAGLLMLTILVIGVVGCAVVPPFAARRRAEPSALVLASVSTALACALLAFMPGVPTGIVAAVPIGLFLLSALPVALALVERRNPASAGPIASIIWLSGNVGGVAVSFVVGELLDRPGVAFGLFAVLTLAAAVVARGLQQREDDVARAEGHDELAERG